MRLSGREVYAPQRYNLGQEGQVDWFDGIATLGGNACKLKFFAMRFTGLTRMPRSGLDCKFRRRVAAQKPSEQSINGHLPV